MVRRLYASQANKLPELEGAAFVDARYSTFYHVDGDQIVIDNRQYKWTTLVNIDLRLTIVISPLAVILMVIGACAFLILG